MAIGFMLYYFQLMDFIEKVSFTSLASFQQMAAILKRRPRVFTTFYCLCKLTRMVSLYAVYYTVSNSEVLRHSSVTKSSVRHFNTMICIILCMQH